MAKFLISTTPKLEGKEIRKYLGVVIASEVLGVDVISELVATFTDGFGGRSGTFRNNLEELNDYVQTAIIKKAKKLGANAIVGYNVDFNELSGKGKQMFMATATGTAVVIASGIENAEEESNEVLIYNSQLESAIKKDEILSHLSEQTGDEDWEALENDANEDTAKGIIDFYDSTPMISVYIAQFVKHLASYINKVNSEEVTTYLYDKMLQSSEPSKIAKVLNEANLFEPAYVLQMINGDQKLYETALSLLLCAKKKYTNVDVKNMVRIRDSIKMEEKGHIISKKAMFGTKQIFVCPDGHESEAAPTLERCYCEVCKKNAYGFTPGQLQKIKAYRKRVDDILRVVGKEI